MSQKKLWTSTVIAIAFMWLIFFSLFSAVPVFATTYSVTINTYYNNHINGNTVPILKDGLPTGFNTPHTFTGLTGTHNFTVPYVDDASHPFAKWTYAEEENSYEDPLTTITVSSEQTFWAFYFNKIDRNYLTLAQLRYLITPKDPAVIAATFNMSWARIVDFVAALEGTNTNRIPQFPNQTLVSGSDFLPDHSVLLTSMLRASGYRAYMAVNKSCIYNYWVVIELEGAFKPLNPFLSWIKQQTFNFSGFQPEFFMDEDGVYLASQKAPTPNSYSITINTYLDNTINGNIVPIIQDGVSTGYYTPHTFSGLTGVHNFTVQYEDAIGNHFDSWISNPPSNKFLTTITVSSRGSYWAVYDSGFNLSQPARSQYRHFITPNDPAVKAAAANKSWIEIVNFVTVYLRQFIRAQVNGNFPIKLSRTGVIL